MGVGMGFNSAMSPHLHLRNWGMDCGKSGTVEAVCIRDHPISIYKDCVGEPVEDEDGNVVRYGWNTDGVTCHYRNPHCPESEQPRVFTAQYATTSRPQGTS